MDMENGDQVTERGCLFTQDSRGGVITPRVLGGVSNPYNPPYLSHCLTLQSLYFFLFSIYRTFIEIKNYIG